jgi:flagellar biosynthesis protein FlhF
MVEQRFSSLAWQDNLKRRPAAVNLMCQLLAAGFSSALARAASNALPDNCVGASARSWARRQLAAKLECLNGEEELIARGGVYAFSGPTGVGKTTTVAKIGARCVVKHGAQSLGLITTDSYRIGAQDQLRVFGRILGVPVHTVHDATGLAETLQQLSGKRLVLVDTIGMGQRDERVSEQLQMLDGCGVSRVVVLPANAQLETLEDVISIYANRAEGAKVTGAILSKVDEAVKLGAGLDVLLRHRLPLLFCANGQRVPEDLVIPAREALIDAALAAASRHTERFGAEEATLFASWAKDEGLAAGVAYA